MASKEFATIKIVGKKPSALTGRKVTYCKESKTLYVYLADRIRKGLVHKTEENNYLVLVDRDKKGNPIGVEIVGIEL